MIIIPVRTHKITPSKDKDIRLVLDKYLPKLREKSVVAITSKILGICEGRVIEVTDKDDKKKLVIKESDSYLLPSRKSKHKIFLTIKNKLMVASAGIDESNGGGYYVFWPENPQKSANSIRRHLIKKHKIKYLGVVVTDSKTTPLQRGVTGRMIAHSGFRALRDYVGEKDIFGHLLRVTQANVADGLAASAVVVIGEGREQTPMALIEDIPFVEFVSGNPGREEINELKIDLDNDLYASILKRASWRKGGGGKG